MTKAFVDELISNMKHADFVSKASPWTFEGIGDKKMNTRFVGMKMKDDWLSVFSENNNILLKFIYDRNDSYIECYLANATPFIKMMTLRFSENDKWEPILGELKRRLKKDKSEFLNHTEQVNNIYTNIKPRLK